MDDLTFWKQMALREMARRIEAERRLQHDRARHKAAMAKVRRWADGLGLRQALLEVLRSI